MRVVLKNNYDFPAYLSDGKRVWAYCLSVKDAQALAAAWNAAQQQNGDKAGDKAQR